MKFKMNHVFPALALLALTTLNSQLSTAQAQGTAFTYQGRLNTNAVPASGFFDFQFALYPNAAGTGELAGLTLTNVGVTNGLFTVTLNFGDYFTGNSVWLAISARSNGVGTYAALTPLQELNPAPYSIFANTASNLSGTLPVAQLSGAIPLAQLPPGLVTNTEGGVTLSNLTLQGLLTLPSTANIFAGGNSLFIDAPFNNFYAGPSAGISNGTGGANTGLGAGSLNSNTNGTNNTAVGYQSLNNNSNGSYNVAIGERTLFNNVSGNNNTAEGRHALENNTAGNDNTANGYQALLNGTGSNNTAAGSGALSGLVSGSYNIAVGYQAGSTYTGNASSNILIGNQGVSGDNLTIRIGDVQTTTYIAGVIYGNGAGLTNVAGANLLTTPGTENFFAGQSAGNSSLTGIYNTAVGGSALANDSGGNYNTAAGESALYANSTGGNNTAFGTFALEENTNGSGNSAFGSDALLYNTSGSDNTAAGYGAMLYSSTGSYNTGTGAYALSAVNAPLYVVGNNNTADGAYALAADESGYGNTAVGYSSLYNVQSGFNNIALGFDAGYNITGNSNIDIGHPGVSSDNMTIRIGSGQTSTYIAGVIYGNGAGLTNVGGLLADPGTLNFFAGPNAGNATLSGADNVGVGSYTLTDLTTGDYNTAVGVGSLEDTSMGSYNTALGDDAMAFNTTGNNNTAVGVEAMAFSSTGYDNTATGYSALLFSSSGYNNTATGVSAMGGGSVTGDGNTGTGGDALEYLTSGYNNTAAGYTALQANTTGVDNVGVGVNALVASQTGSENTAIGTYTLVNLTNGSFNTAIGLDAGYFLASGSGNIYIGNYGEATDNNVIRIGEAPTATYIGNANCPIALDGSDTNNGLVYQSASGLPGINSSEGPFLYGFYGGSLGAVAPNTVCLSWDYSGDVWVSNNCSVATLSIRGGSDLAEPFKITSGSDALADGSVMVIDKENPGHLKVSSQPYDKRVAGILSGANGINPGIQMQQQGLLDGDRNVALTGRVYVQADASNGAIEPGDQLTTSSTPGRAMKVTDYIRAQGAILGKAMTGLNEGNGMVLVLVTLQ